MNYTDKHIQDYKVLSGDKTKRIPKEMAQLINLQNLQISNTYTKKIPKEIAQLINLQDFCITEKQSLFNKIITNSKLKNIIYPTGAILLSLTGYWLFMNIKNLFITN